MQTVMGEPGAHREHLRPLLSYVPLVYIKALLVKDRGLYCCFWGNKEWV